MIVGVDIGGTFTDFVCLGDGELKVHKLPSTPPDLARGFLQGLEDLGVRSGTIVHGSTVATNALLERKGARTGLITTKGFRDVLDIGRQARPQLYDLWVRKGPALIERALRMEVDERVDAHGDVLRELREEEVETALDALTAAGVESVAVSLLFSFLNPAHERMIEQMAKRRGFFTSASCEILPEYREYERTSTVAVNAYVSPLMDRYLCRLEDGLETGEWHSFRIMQSNGGVITAQTARTLGVRTALSGPAAGVVGAAYIASLAGYRDVISFDMGGTSTDVSLIPGEIQYTTESSIGGLPIRIPMIDIQTVGAGGGSIAYFDVEGPLMVGPRSAGADPGPMCYGKGTEPTVTDADVLMGRINPNSFLGGRIKLDVMKAMPVFTEMGKDMWANADKAISGVVSVANSNMERAIRVVSVERGFDPRQFTLVSFGGAGPVHAVDLAENLRMPRVLVPRYPGVLSALGMLAADLTKDYSRTVMWRAEEVSPQALEEGFQGIEARGWEEMRLEGMAADRVSAHRFLDLRYVGQSYELIVPVESLDVEQFLARFHEMHGSRYGHTHPEEPVEIVNLRVRMVGRVDKPQLAWEEECPSHPERAEVGERLVYFFTPAEGYWRSKVYDREKLLPGDVVEGPAAIEQMDTTTVVPRRWNARVDGFRNLILERA